MQELEHLWREYKSTGSKIAKDKLLVEYSHLVKYAAGRLAINLPQSVDRDDLYGAGILGLIKAVETFDPLRGFKFETYASHKIRGAILDELRALDWVPRTVRQKARNLQKVFSKLEHKYGRSPYDDEVCEELGISMEEYEEVLSEVAPVSFVSFDDPVGTNSFSDSKEMHISDRMVDHDSVTPHDATVANETAALLRDAIADLNENERAVIALYHYEELTLKEIGAAMKLTESRVSQIHSKAMMKLRGRLQKNIDA